MKLRQTNSAGLLASAVLLFMTGAGCHAQESVGRADAAVSAAGKEVAPGVLQVGRIVHPRITESSGLVASRQYPGVLWTHNDGGGGRKQVLYAMDRDGRSLGEVYVADALFMDWEDIAIDNEKHLYIGDLGNNEVKRTEIAVYQVDEPNPRANTGFIQPKRAWKLRFPGEPFDCESLFVWDGNGYVVSKVFRDARAQIFRFPLTETKEPVTLELVATTKIESPVTGADISPDGALLALVAKSGAFLYRVDGNPAKAGKGKPFQTKFRHEHIEACAFVPGGLLATAESREIYLFTEAPFRWKQGNEGK